MTPRDLDDIRPFSIYSNSICIAFSIDIPGTLVTSSVLAFRLFSSTPLYTGKGILLDNNIVLLRMVFWSMAFRGYGVRFLVVFHVVWVVFVL